MRGVVAGVPSWASVDAGGLSFDRENSITYLITKTYLNLLQRTAGPVTVASGRSPAWFLFSPPDNPFYPALSYQPGRGEISLLH